MSGDRAWSPKQWWTAASISRTTYFRLPPDARPRSMVYNKRRFIIESPIDWIKRVGSTDKQARTVPKGKKDEAV